jgi:hypothetical protein
MNIHEPNGPQPAAYDLTSCGLSGDLIYLNQAQWKKEINEYVILCNKRLNQFTAVSHNIRAMHITPNKSSAIA